jgi:hypothetical protein
MTWGTSFKTDISLLRETYSSEIDIEDTINELNTDIRDLESKIKMFTTVSFREIITEEWKDEPINWINNQINELFKSYSELIIRQYKLELYLDYVKEYPEHKLENDHE